MVQLYGPSRPPPIGNPLSKAATTRIEAATVRSTGQFFTSHFMASSQKDENNMFEGSLSAQGCKSDDCEWKNEGIEKCKEQPPDPRQDFDNHESSSTLGKSFFTVTREIDPVNLMIRAEELKRYIDFAYSAYQEHNIVDQEYRRVSQAPYITHALWAATMLLADTDVPQEERETGAKALLLHDVLEDTDLPLPDWVDPEVKNLVEQMTFKNWEDTKKRVPLLPVSTKLLVLYDKLMTLYEDKKDKNRRKGEWKEFCQYLLDEVEKQYGNIRIVQIGKAIIANSYYA